MVRAGSILILAKVTTSVDWETNQLVQKIRREDFADSASITVLRPISVIFDTDRVAVISDGKWSSCWRAILPISLGVV
jgi:ABC-type multidrug transport system fused ATPase/permease subunit